MEGLMLLTVKCVLSVLTVVGNVFVIAAFFIRPSIRNTRSNIFIISLGMCDASFVLTSNNRAVFRSLAH